MNQRFQSVGDPLKEGELLTDKVSALKVHGMVCRQRHVQVNFTQVTKVSNQGFEDLAQA